MQRRHFYPYILKKKIIQIPEDSLLYIHQIFIKHYEFDILTTLAIFSF